MGSFKRNYDEGDIALSAFALALALPVRIFIIRTIINRENSAVKDDFANPLFNAETIAKHLQQLKALKILTSLAVSKTVRYSVNTVYFKAMSQSFTSFMQPLDDAPAKSHTITGPTKAEEHTMSFGDYLKMQRQSYQLTQAEMAERLDMDRSVLSKVETGRTVFPEDKLLVLSQKIHEDIGSIKKIYYSDHLAKLIRKGNLDDSILQIARIKSGGSK